MQPKSVVLVTGGTGGIGYAMVKALANPETKVYFTFHSNVDKAKAIESELAGSFVRGLRCDIKDIEAVRQTVETVLEAEEGIDVLINAFGITKDKPLVLMADEDWHDVIDTNLNGTYNVTRSIVFSMMKRKRGVILNVSSVSGLHGLPGQTNYSSSKAAMIGFSKALAKEVAPKNIRVNVLAPGFIETAMTDKLSDEYKEKMKAFIPLNRLGTVDDLIGITKFLISDASSYITGQVFSVDGGMFI